MNSDAPVALIALSSLLAFAAVLTAGLWWGNVWDSYARRHVGEFTPRLRDLGMDDSGVQSFMRWWGICIFATFLIVGVMLAMIPVAIGLCYLIFLAPHFILDWLIGRRQKQMREQLVRASVALANTARANLGLVEGLRLVTAETERPLRDELSRIINNYDAGKPIEESIRDLQARVNLEPFTIFCSTLLVCLRQGGKLAFALERISDGLHELSRLEGKLEADSAAGRQLAIVLAMFPIGFLAVFSMMDWQSARHLFQTIVGQFILVIVGALVYLAFRWCIKILDIDI